MIEKLQPTVRGFDDSPSMPTATDFLNKINELVDAVNNIVSVQEKLIDSRFVVETKHEEPADTFAKQRKWIGKLCKFWDYDITHTSYSVLDEINEYSEHPYIKPGGNVYKHCEPVKPDDDIIYKGE